MKQVEQRGVDGGDLAGSVVTLVARGDIVDYDSDQEGDLEEGLTIGANFRPTEETVIRIDHNWRWTTPVAGELLDLKMPAWMPGFYRIMDYQKYVSNFRASDGRGRPLDWEKITRNGWRVVASGAATVVVDYDVFGNTNFAANNFLDETRAFIAPPGMFLYPDGRLQTPVTLTVERSGKVRPVRFTLIND